MRRAPSRTRLARFPRRPALLVADPSPLFLRGIAHVGALVGAEVATASAPAALELRARARPQHVLLANPGLWPCDGWGWLGELRAHRKAPVGILVEHGRRWEMERAIGLGYDAYIDKRWLTSLLLPTVIRTLLAGGLVYLAGDREPHGDVTSLTLREFEVLQFLRDGLSVGDIARRLLQEVLAEDEFDAGVGQEETFADVPDQVGGRVEVDVEEPVDPVAAATDLHARGGQGELPAGMVLTAVLVVGVAVKLFDRGSQSPGQPVGDGWVVEGLPQHVAQSGGIGAGGGGGGRYRGWCHWRLRSCLWLRAGGAAVGCCWLGRVVSATHRQGGRRRRGCRASACS